jgi:hypothetical protein
MTDMRYQMGGPASHRRCPSAAQLRCAAPLRRASAAAHPCPEPQAQQQDVWRASLFG